MNNKSYNCNDCNKRYSSYKSLWTHNKNHHNGINTIRTEKQNEIVKEVIEYGCRMCNKKYKHKQTRYKHEKTCNDIIKRPDREMELEKMRQDTLDKEQKILELKIKLQSMKKIDDKTFKTINKLLMDRSIINNTQININFPNILGLGKENISETLSRSDKKLILDSRHNSIDKIVEIAHCGTYNMFKNIVITNLKDKFAYKYDETKGYFITGNKSVLLGDLLTYRIMDIETIYDELSTAKKIDSKTKKFLQDFLDKMDNISPFSLDDVDYPNFKSYKIDKIKILLYNNRDKLTHDIALIIGEKTSIQEQVLNRIAF